MRRATALWLVGASTVALAVAGCGGLAASESAALLRGARTTLDSLEHRDASGFCESLTTEGQAEIAGRRHDAHRSSCTNAIRQRIDRLAAAYKSFDLAVDRRAATVSVYADGASGEVRFDPPYGRVLEVPLHRDAAHQWRSVAIIECGTGRCEH
jgi:hypothetical protein